MSHPDANPPRKRTRTIFHYKIEELLREQDREAYLALIVDPQTTNLSAHAWLRERGSALSLSAVARHRRRRIASAAEERREMQRTMALAEYLAGPDAPDFARAAQYQFQHMVFHLLRVADADMARRDESPPADNDIDINRRKDAEELTRLCKLVQACVNLTVTQVRHDLQKAPPAKEVKPPRDDETLRADIEAILKGRNPRR
jgi:hypothetical protein